MLNEPEITYLTNKILEMLKSNKIDRHNYAESMQCIKDKSITPHLCRKVYKDFIYHKQKV